MIHVPRRMQTQQQSDFPFAASSRDAACGSDAAGQSTIIAALLASRGIRITPPGPRDLIILLRGLPVAPWMPLRAAAEVWVAWLGQLERLWSQWDEVRPEATLVASSAARWGSWRAEHVVSLEARRVGPAVRLLAGLLASPSPAREAIHLVGHSVGGAAILTYLAHLRAQRLPLPTARLRTAITLDAAVSGVAGVWSGARRALGDAAGRGLDGLGVWAARRGVAVVTATNRHDMWSHRALGDLAYLPFRLGPPRGLLRQLDGTIHGWLRRTPHLVEALWGAEPSAATNERVATSSARSAFSDE